MKCYQNTYLLTYDNDYNTIRNEILTKQLLADITYTPIFSRNIGFVHVCLPIPFIDYTKFVIFDWH